MAGSSVERPGAADEVAEIASLRRIAAIATVWSGVFLLAFLAAGRLGAALVLTGVAAAAIVAFRGLEGVVRRLRPETVDGEVRPEGTHRLVVRWLLLAAILVTAALLGRGQTLAVIAGVTVVPLAVITEAMWRLLRLGRNGDT